MFRSSIFNFESCRSLKPALPLGLLGALALVLLVETAFRLVPDRVLYPAYTRMGIGHFFEDSIVPQFKSSRVLIFGTSRGREAFMPRLVDDTLGFPDKSTLNMSTTGARTTDWIEMYSRNESSFSDVKIAVIALDDWTFSSGVATDQLFRLNATFSERFNFSKVPEENSGSVVKTFSSSQHQRLRAESNQLLADYFLQSRVKMKYVFPLINSMRQRSERFLPVLDQYHMVHKISDDAPNTNKNPQLYRERAQKAYVNFDLHPVYLKHAETLARKIQSHGGQVLFVQLPNRRAYQSEADALFPGLFESHRKTIEDFATSVGATAILPKYPEEIGLNDEHYKDYGHLNRAGALICTQWLSTKIKELSPSRASK